METKIAFVAWSVSQRTKVLAHYLQADIISSKISFTNPLLRILHYKLLSVLTLIKLCRKNYETVFVQVPPIHAAPVIFLYTKIFGKKITFDTHSAIFLPKGIHQHLYFHIYRYMIKHINLNIVHNQSILACDCLKGSYSVLLEPFNPGLQNQPNILPEANNITVICSYANDEPVVEILNAAKILPEYKFHLTGDYTKTKISNDNIPNNLELTGYLPNDKYIDLLCNSEIIIALTTRPKTVLNGAYEAVSLVKPLITSDTPTLREHFTKGTIFTHNDATAIAESIKKVKHDINRLKTEMDELRKEKLSVWEKQFSAVRHYITTL